MSKETESPDSLTRYEIKAEPFLYTAAVPTEGNNFLMIYQVQNGGHQGSVLVDSRREVRWYDINLAPRVSARGLARLSTAAFGLDAGSTSEIVESIKLFPECHITPNGVSFILPADPNQENRNPAVFIKLNPDRSIAYNDEITPDLELDNVWRYNNPNDYRLKNTGRSSLLLSLTFGRLSRKFDGDKGYPVQMNFTAHASFGLGSVKEVYDLFQRGVKREIFVAPSDRDLRQLVDLTCGVNLDIPF